MQKNYFNITFILVALICTSCQKGYVVPNERTALNTDSTSKGLLKKQVVKNIADNFESTIAEYMYDSSGRLSQLSYIGKRKNADGSISEEQQTRKYFRDVLGRLIRIGELTDSVYLLVDYDSRSSSVKSVSDNLDRFTTTFEYDTDGHIKRLNFFMRTPSAVDPKRQVGYHDHVFDAKGNLIEKIFYQDDDLDGIFNSPIRFRFEYDDKINPRYPVDDALFPETWSLSSPNSNIRQFNFYTDPSVIQDTVNYSYTYDDNKKPVRSITNGETETVYFYY